MPAGTGLPLAIVAGMAVLLGSFAAGARGQAAQEIPKSHDSKLGTECRRCRAAYRKALDHTLARLPQALADNAHLGLSWWPGADVLVVTCADRTSSPPSSAAAQRRWQGAGRLRQDLGRVLAWLGAQLPERRTRLHTALAWLARRRAPVVGWSETLLAPRLLPPPVRPAAPRAVWHLPAERAAEALAAARACLAAGGPDPVELRFVRADDILLSPAFERDLCVLTVPGVDELGPELGLALGALCATPDGRARWAEGPGAARFRVVRDALDPERLFGAAPRRAGGA